MRRSTFTDQPVTYAAVGATLAHDLTQHPPKGYRPHASTIRLGSGDDRFATSARALMTWGVQRGSGVEVTHVDPGTGEEYAGVHYAADGTPERLQQHHGTEAVFDEDGNPYITNGMTAVLRVPLGPFHVNAPVRVVYVIEEERRVGFGYGTMHGHPLSGEESFILEQRDDDSVWLTMRSFSRAAGGARAMVAPVARVSQTQLAKRYLRALHPVTGNSGVGALPAADAETAGPVTESPAVVAVTVHHPELGVPDRRESLAPEPVDTPPIDPERVDAAPADREPPTSGHAEQGRPETHGGADDAERSSDR
jgi:uncharacterized protein (UPF0548 family)